MVVWSVGWEGVVGKVAGWEGGGGIYMRVCEEKFVMVGPASEWSAQILRRVYEHRWGWGLYELVLTL